MPLEIIFHPKVALDVQEVMNYYERVAGSELAGEFYDEFLSAVRHAAETPEAYNLRFRDLRRVNLHRFPFNFLFRVVGKTIRILVLRHHSRKPSFGIRRD